MLRTKCIWCGKTVRGGDDWSGLTGKCPNCGAEIIFPRVGPPPTEPLPAKPTSFLNADDYWNATGWAAAVAAALLGITAWTWFWLIIYLAYGRGAYHFGLRVETVSKSRGIVLTNGESIGIIWNVIFAVGFATTWALLMRGANYLAVRSEPKSKTIAPILLLGLMATCRLSYQVFTPHYKIGHFESSPERQVVMIAFAALLVGGLTFWRKRMSAVKP